MQEGRVEDPKMAKAMALEEDKGRNREPRGAIARGLAKAKETVFGNKKLEEAQESAEQVGEKLEAQKKAVQDFVATLENAMSPAFEEERRQAGNQYVGPKKVSTFEDEYNGTEILVSYWNPNMRLAPQDIVRVYVNFLYPYPDGKGAITLVHPGNKKVETFSIDEIDTAKQRAREIVENFRISQSEK